MADEAAEEVRSDKKLVALSLRPIHGSRNEQWQVHLEEDLLSLHAPDGRIVMMLPREESALHIRFDWDLLRGRMVSFEVVEGLKAYRFRCGLRDLRALLGWLPRKSREELEKEVRFYGVAVVLIGVFQLLFPAYYFWGWGLGCVGVGLAGVCFPRRWIFAVNALGMLFVGAGLLFEPHPRALLNDAYIDFARVMPTGLGSLLLIWSIQQFSLLGAGHRLRMARRKSTAPEMADEDRPSAVVRKVMWFVGILAVLLVGQVIGLVLQWYLGAVKPMFRDWVLCVTLASVAVGAVAVLRLRLHAAYLEARIAGQFTVVLGVLYLAGVMNVPIEGSLPFPPEILWIGLFALGQPYVWAPLVLLVVLFNRWFVRAVAEELEEVPEEE